MTGARRAGTGAQPEHARRRRRRTRDRRRRVTDRLQVDADLVCAAGVEAQAQQREGAERTLDLEVGARLARMGAVDGHARAHARITPDGGLDRAGARRRATLHERAGTRARSDARRARAANRRGPPPSARRRADRRCRGPGDERCRRAADPDRRPRGAPAAGRACRSRWPRAGCTTRPAGLSITSRCSSS